MPTRARLAPPLLAFAPLSPSDGNVYQAVDTLGPDGVRALGQEERNLSPLLSMSILAATPAGAIGPRMLP